MHTKYNPSSEALQTQSLPAIPSAKGKVIQAYGVPTQSPYNISMQLTELGVSHSIHVKERKHQIPYLNFVAERQPYWVSVVETVAALRTPMPKKDHIVFVCDSSARLQSCNLGIMPFAANAPELKALIKEALIHAKRNPIVEGWELKETQPSMDDYVGMASNPSFLNIMETVRYKINPYDLRKAIAVPLLKYLNSSISPRELFRILKSSYRYEKLLLVMREPGAENLRNAVAYFKANNLDVETVANQFNIDTFDINYVVSKSKEATDSKAAKMKSKK